MLKNSQDDLTPDDLNALSFVSPFYNNKKVRKYHNEKDKGNVPLFFSFQALHQV